MIDYNIRGMNKHIVEANVKLQDENKLLKEDKEILQRRIEKAIEYIEKWQNFQHTNGSTHEELRNLKGILKGEYIKEEK